MKEQKEEEGGQEWLGAYANMITPVLTLFILLYSISNINVDKLEEVASAIQRRLGIEFQTKLEDVLDDLKYPTIGKNMDEPSQAVTGSQSTQVSAKEMRQISRGIQTYFGSESLDTIVSNTEDTVYIRLKNDLLFDPDSADLRGGNKSILDAAGIMLQEKQGNTLTVYINGHTVQAANSLINDKILSSERADNVTIYLKGQVGFNPKKLICRGYDKYYLIAGNTTKRGRGQNHRMDMIVLGNGHRPPESVEGVETMDPLSPVVMPRNEVMIQEGAASD